jgi:hypothetical protein
MGGKAMTAKSVTGGCQCGRIRYRASGKPSQPHICHCRMCQKASGNYFMPFAGFLKENFEVTRGAIAWFQSSDPIRRGFCANCGTPLIFETIGAPYINIALGSLDDPSAIQPKSQYGTESRLEWFDQLSNLPGEATEDTEYQEGVALADIKASNHQHPDHDTGQWPPEEPVR